MHAWIIHFLVLTGIMTGIYLVIRYKKLNKGEQANIKKKRRSDE